MSSDSLTTSDDDSHCSCYMISSLLLATWVVLFYVKTPVQFYIKFTTYVLTVMIFSLFAIFFCLLRPCDARNVGVVAKILSVLFRIFRIDIQLENGKYLQLKEPYIIISNHQSSLDFMTMMKVWPGGYCTPLAKKELFYSWPFGLAIWLCGITFIDRLNPQRARGTIDKLAEKINNENLRVWIYPEGTRSPSTQLLPFKKGAFHLAVQAQIPIICIVTSSYSNFYNKKEKKFEFDGKVKCRVLPPFQTAGMSLDSVGELTKHLQDKMQKEFDLLNKEIGLEEKYYTKCVKSDNDVTRQDLDYTQMSDLTQINSLINQTSLLNDSNNNSINDDDSNKKSN